MTVSPDGSTVFVTGESDLVEVDAPYITIAYDALFGTVKWIARYEGSLQWEGPSAIAVTPDGSKVIVSGQSSALKTGEDFATIAFDAATGERRWVARYDGPAGGNDGASTLVVSPDSSRVFVSGTSSSRRTGGDLTTISYDARNGKAKWIARYDGPGRCRGLEENFDTDGARRVAVSPDGSRVFVTGTSQSTSGCSDFATIAYEAATGKRLWRTRYGGERADYAADLVVGSHGKRVFVTGSSLFADRNSVYATIAYDAKSGRVVWIRRYETGGNGHAMAMALDAGASRIYVTGSSDFAPLGGGFGTVAYDARTGRVEWTGSHDNLGLPGRPTDLAVTPSGSHVLVTGSDGLGSYSTVVYDAHSGLLVWTANSPGVGGASALAISPDGTRAFVTGWVSGARESDMLTVGYLLPAGALPQA